MAKTAHKAKKGVAAAKRKPAAPAAPKRTAPKLKPPGGKYETQLDFSTARHLADGDHRKPQNTHVFAFLVDDVDGNEMVYHCLPGQVPAEARAALAASE